MLTDDYRVHLDAFDGPLDLLLFLIKKAEVDIHDIPIASITDQYMSYLGQIEKTVGARIDIDTAGEFLVMAASLMEIKSRMLVPGATRPATSSDSDTPAEDPRAELVRQLLAYKKYRDAADDLERRAIDWSQRFPSAPVGVDRESWDDAVRAASESTDLEDLDVLDLVEAFQRISEAVNFERLGDHQVTYDDTPLELHAEDLLDRLKRESAEPAETGATRETPFAAIFTGRTRGEMVGLFLAMLHLVARRHVGVRQDSASGAIFLRVLESEADATPLSMPME